MLQSCDYYEDNPKKIQVTRRLPNNCCHLNNNIIPIIHYSKQLSTFTQNDTYELVNNKVITIERYIRSVIILNLLKSWYKQNNHDMTL